MKGLYKRKDKSQFYGIRRVIPARLRHLMGDKTELKASLGTADYNEALSKAPTVWLDFANAIAKAKRQLKAEQSFTDADIELIAGLWTSRIMAQEELIKERYLIDDYEHGLSRTVAPVMTSSVIIWSIKTARFAISQIHGRPAAKYYAS